MAAYWIGEHAVTDPAKFESYLAKAIPIIERFGGRYLTRVGAHEAGRELAPKSGCCHRVPRHGGNTGAL